MKPQILVIAMLGSLTMGATRGCSNPPPQRAVGCPTLQCETDCGSAGHLVGADGCEVCACQTTQCLSEVSCDPDCTATTNSNGCAVCQCPENPTSCMQDSECPEGQACDIINYCDAAPGCADGGGCPAVCYGRCVPRTDECAGAAWGPTGVCQGPADGPLPSYCCEGQPDPCAGASLNSAGVCVGPTGVEIAAQCCPTTTTCGDGSEILCDRPAIGTCEGPLVAAPRNSCTWCFDAITCEPQCFVDSDCDRGTTCQADMNDACNGPTARCSRPGVKTCQAANVCGPVCDVYCPYGNVIDANGCETCACNPEPSCVCTREYAPVCGADGNTYSNSCEAECAQTEVAYSGECGPTCAVDCFRPDPVCGADGQTYWCGAADAACNHTTVAYEGECGETCAIECLVYEPVCGADGVTYGCGAADAACHHTTVAYEGECGQETCSIQCLVYQPVCGADGVTYGCGAADAACHNTTVAYEGECTTACTVDSDCDSGETCFFRAPLPWERRPAPAGKCEPYGYCESEYDCSGLVAPACLGAWSCETNRCTYTCGR